MTAFIRSKAARGLFLGLVLVAGLMMRLYRLSWDDGYLFHPDERQILIVVDSLSLPWPLDWASLLDPSSSWNPKFFAYGSLPIYLLRACASLAGVANSDYADLNSSYVVGRFLSAVFDVGTIFLIYRLGRKLYDEKVGLLAAFLVAFAVLHIQLSHFYAVDTLLAFFVVLSVSLSIDLARKPSLWRGVLAGGAAGLAIATKISALPLMATIVLAWGLGVATSRDERPDTEPRRAPLRLLGLALFGCAVSGLSALLTFVVCEPYAVLDVVSFLVDVLHEGRMARGTLDVPYTRQYLGTLPYIYPTWQAMVWSMGLPLGMVGFSALAAALGQCVLLLGRGLWQRLRDPLLPLSWVLIYFGLVGSFHAKFLRYMLPIIPFLCLWAAWVLLTLVRAEGRGRALRRAIGGVGLVSVMVGTALYGLAYLNVFRQTHPWIQATTWLCRNLAGGSRIVIEHWDDPLPLMQGMGDLRCFRNHQVTTLKVYDPDDTRKLEMLLSAVEENEYIILSSNRLYNTIPRLPRRYPLTSRYYELLFGERLGYQLIYYATSHPQLFGISLMDDTFSDPPLPRPRLVVETEATRRALVLGRADESFTVYDHPKPLVFRKTQQLSRQELLDLFGAATRGLPEPKAKLPGGG